MTRAFAAMIAAGLAVPAASAATLDFAPPAAGHAAAMPAAAYAAAPAPWAVPAAVAAAPLAAPALAPAVSAASARAAASLPELPAAKSSAEAPAREGARFDGTAAPGLKSAVPADASWLASVVESLRRTKTGRRVLRDVAALEGERGHPLLVIVQPLSVDAEYRYGSDLLAFDSGHRKRPAEQSAPILAHELQHALQRQRGLPADALELEVESFVVENRVWSELGVAPARGSFSAMVRRRLLRDFDAFMPWLEKKYSDSRPLRGGTMKSYIAWLEEYRPNFERREDRIRKELARARRVIGRMRSAGEPADQVRNSADEDVLPVEIRLRQLVRAQETLEHDLALLSTAEGRRLFRAYSRGVVRRARALAR